MSPYCVSGAVIKSISFSPPGGEGSAVKFNGEEIEGRTVLMTGANLPTVPDAASRESLCGTHPFLAWGDGTSSNWPGLLELTMLSE